MKKTSLLLNVSIIMLISFIIYLILYYPHAMINPGELVAGHQKLKNSCTSCHEPFGGIEEGKCISCHKLTDIGRDTLSKPDKTLFHQYLLNQRCSSCHSDHLGLVPEHPLDSFNHVLLSKTLVNNCNSCHEKPADNLHKQIASTCNGCHQTTSWKKTIEFDHQVLLNQSDCASCHQKPNDNYHNTIKENCSKCHTTQQWVPSTFDHSAYFVLDENHNSTCTTCHKKNNYNTYTCYGCHEHSERNIIAEHNEEGIYKVNNCISCHKSGSENGEENGENRNEEDN